MVIDITKPYHGIKVSSIQKSSFSIDLALKRTNLVRNVSDEFRFQFRRPDEGDGQKNCIMTPG